MRTIHWLFAVGAALFVFGIGFVVVGARASREVPVAVATPLTPVASVKQIMDAIVDPAATVVYESVGSVVTIKGIEETAPKNDEEWAAVGTGAAAVAEAGNLLMMEGRAIDRGEWMTISRAMIDAARETMRAVDAKSTDGILQAGSNLNDTCDSCHARYRRE